MTMHLAGIPVRDQAILDLARLVDNPLLADKLEAAHGREVKVLGLEISERMTILAALDDPPPDLAELRAVLLQEHVGRVRDGLA